MKNGYTTMKDSLWTGNGIAHYYGDYVRILFIAVAAVSFIVVPVWGDILPLPIVTQVAAALLLVLLAGFTSAQAKFVMIANATVSAVSIVLLESAAIALRGVGENATQLYYAREASVLMLLAALYFSIKTIRGMLAGKIGRNDSPFEFFEAEIESFEDKIMPGRQTDVSDYNE